MMFSIYFIGYVSGFFYFMSEGVEWEDMCKYSYLFNILIHFLLALIFKVKDKEFIIGIFIALIPVINIFTIYWFIRDNIGISKTNRSDNSDILDN